MMEERKSAASVFSRLGLGFSVFLIVTVIAQFLFTNLPQWLLGEENALAQSEAWMWVCNIVPMYLIAFPLFYTIIRKLPKVEKAETKLGAKRFWMLVPLCFSVMYAGNLLGNLLAIIFGRGMSDNFVQDLVMTTHHPLKYLVLLVVAPVMEELTFRKLLLDRAIPYGERTAVLLSGLLFGLFHQNLYQFFYAFGVGVVLAYVYVRSRRIRYSILMHIMFNVFGGVLAPMILKLSQGMLQIDFAAMETSQIIQALFVSLLSLAFSGVTMGLFVGGIVIFCLRFRKTQWEESALQLPKREIFRTVYVNAGMGLFIVLCLTMIVLSHIFQW